MPWLFVKKEITFCLGLKMYKDIAMDILVFIFFAKWMNETNF